MKSLILEAQLERLSNLQYRHSLSGQASEERQVILQKQSRVSSSSVPIRSVILCTSARTSRKKKVLSIPVLLLLLATVLLSSTFTISTLMSKGDHASKINTLSVDPISSGFPGERQSNGVSETLEALRELNRDQHYLGTLLEEWNTLSASLPATGMEGHTSPSAESSNRHLAKQLDIGFDPRIEPVKGAVIHRSADGRIDGWLVKYPGGNLETIMVTPIGATNLGVAVHAIDSNLDFFIDTAGQWSPIR